MDVITHWESGMSHCDTLSNNLKSMCGYSYKRRGHLGCKYSVMQKDGLSFVHLYFLNYTWYVNDLDNI